ncbi:MAG: PilZ domain-containing protein, partial [Deferrisomatales bacterium]
MESKHLETPHPAAPGREAAAGCRARERRQGARSLVAARVDYASAGEARRALLVDMGPGGVFVATDAPLAPGSPVDLAVPVPGERRVVSASGRVAWTHPAAANGRPAGFGVQLTRFDPGAWERVSRQL